MFSMAWKLHGVFKENELDAGAVLRKFWKSSHWMHALQDDVVSIGCYTSSPRVMFHIARREGEAIDPTGSEDDEDWMTSVWRQKKRDVDAFKKARRGDDLMVQFEYNWCVFVKLKKKRPDLTITTDVLLMACIQQATLDAFWSWAGSTVNGQATLVQKGMALSKLVGLEPPYLEPRPLSAYDHVATEWPFSYSSNHEKQENTIGHISNGTRFVE